MTNARKAAILGWAEGITAATLAGLWLSTSRNGAFHGFSEDATFYVGLSLASVGMVLNLLWSAYRRRILAGAVLALLYLLYAVHLLCWRY